jgi:hypothetical protein
MNSIQRLQSWIYSYCNGARERRFGVKIESIGNPGWMIFIDLDETSMENIPFARFERDESKTRWCQAWRKDNKWEAACGPEMLSETIDLFFRWVDEFEKDVPRAVTSDEFANSFDEVQSWLFSQCDGDYEHSFGVRISTLDKPGWTVWINVEEVPLAGPPFTPVRLEGSDALQWIHTWSEESSEGTLGGIMWRASCGPLMLSETLELFLKWVEQF